MNISHILILTLIAFLVGWLLPKRWRIWALLIMSLLAVYWLQVSSPLRHFDFWLPSASIGLTVFVWSVTTQRSNSNSTQNRLAVIIVLGVVLLVGALRYAGPICCLTPSRPPDLLQISLLLALAAAITLASYFFVSNKKILTIVTIVLILGLFIILKTEPLAKFASFGLRNMTGQSIEFASPLDITWLGFSFLAFRLLHVLRDSQLGRLGVYTLSEFVTYALFFPTYLAGPIDRVQRFVGDLRYPVHTEPEVQAHTATKEWIPSPDYGNLVWGGQRILLGIFKKFVLADSLALIALSGQNINQVNSIIWAWVLLYAYALRIYFDFSGYTDIALGLGALVGFRLPENFNRPYLKQNLTAFWNSWHITLAQWFRAYFFNPLTRYLRTRRHPFPSWTIIFIGQFSTMLLIGLWHGVTLNFAIWGAWHGIGLFVHNRWSAWVRTRSGEPEARTYFNRFMQFSGWFLTFNYVTLGWVWFALPNPESALMTYKTLVGF